MGDQFFIDVPYIRLPNPNHYVNDVNIELDILREQGKADIWYDSLDALDYNLEKGTWYISGLLSGDKEPNDCELNMPGLEITLAVAVAANKKSTVTHPRRIPRLQIAELIENVKGWSKARGILDNGVWYTQATKMYEEDGEGAMGVGKSKRNLIIDAVGDMIVVMVNLMELGGMKAEVIKDMAAHVRDPAKAPPLPKMSGSILNHFLYHKMRKANTNAVDFMWDVGMELQVPKLTAANFTEEQAAFIVGNLTECIYYANALAHCYGFSLEEGLSLAWDEIKDRRGFLNSDGIFVKESDMVATDKIDEIAQDGVPVSYFPVDLTAEQIQTAIDEVVNESGVRPDEVKVVRAGLYYSGESRFPKPHILFELQARGVEAIFAYSDYGDEEFPLTEDGALYTVIETDEEA